MMYQILTYLHSTHESSSAVQQFKHSSGIMSDYYQGLSQLLLLLGGGGTVKCMMGYETRSFPMVPSQLPSPEELINAETRFMTCQRQFCSSYFALDYYSKCW